MLGASEDGLELVRVGRATLEDGRCSRLGDAHLGWEHEDGKCSRSGDAHLGWEHEDGEAQQVEQGQGGEGHGRRQRETDERVHREGGQGHQDGAGGEQGCRGTRARTQTHVHHTEAGLDRGGAALTTPRADLDVSTGTPR